MEIISYETAKRLKAAGFPQPAHSVGQVWYQDKTPAFLARQLNEEIRLYPLFFAEWSHNFDMAKSRKESFGELIFAPGPSEILKQIPMYTAECTTAGNFVLRPNPNNEEHVATIVGLNFVEICAAAWLIVFEENPDKE